MVILVFALVGYLLGRQAARRKGVLRAPDKEIKWA